MNNLIELSWKDVVGYEGYYQVSNFGDVRSCDRYIQNRWGSKTFRKGKVLSKTVRIDGKLPDGSDNYYIGVILHRAGKARYVEVHRLVAQSFIYNPDQLPEVNHKDGVKHNNFVENLEWCTHAQNIQHAVNTGLITIDPIQCRAAGNAAKFTLSKRVYCVTNDRWYASRREAASSLNLPESSVYDSLRDGRPHRGYIFKQEV